MQTEKLEELKQLREKIKQLQSEAGESWWNYQYESDASDLGRYVIELHELIAEMVRIFIEDQTTQPEASDAN